ncbi:phage portal protein [Atopobium fossor]|uniref:phage portal protein n=1 Tax=Atopobium fossor TaxID=39487 RepID=UPI000424C3F7|nr:phage portal protein [Atopobium fossor]
MGLLENLFGNKKQPTQPTSAYFKTFTEYNPAFSTFDGSVYEESITRACIHAFATAVSKLEPHIDGTSNDAIVRAFHTCPNKDTTWSSFLYRVATIYEVDCSCAIIPSFDKRGQINGLYPLKFDLCELVEYGGEVWARFTLPTGDIVSIETRNVCMLSKYQYESDYFGSSNAFRGTMRLLRAQAQAEENAIKIGSKILFIGKQSGMVKPEDQNKKREEFAEDNFRNNNSGLLLYDQTFDSVQPVTHKPYVISDKEMERIDNHVFNYFGCTQDILQNKITEETWDGYYEGKIEPFAIQLSDGLNKMIFSTREQITNRITFTANRLQFMSAASKRNMVRDMVDRGIFSMNEAREILQLPPLEGEEAEMGKKHWIRGEYVDMATLPIPDPKDNPDKDLGGDDQLYNDTDNYGTDNNGER